MDVELQKISWDKSWLGQLDFEEKLVGFLNGHVMPIVKHTSTACNAASAADDRSRFARIGARDSTLSQ